MANGIVPDEGKAAQLTSVLVNAATLFNSWSIILWTNDIVPDEDTVLADLTEATFSGYSRRGLPPADWTNPVVAAHEASSQNGSTARVWTVGGSVDVTVIGHAFVDTVAGVLRLVERWDDADIVAVSPGGTIALLPRFTLRSQTAAE